MTISSPTKTGPNISSGDEIKFSTLRRSFLKTHPKTTYGSSETVLNDSGEVKASNLLRAVSAVSDNLNTGDEFSDVNHLLPFVPDCVENGNISASDNWKTSQFIGAIKYYYIQQSSPSSPGDDDVNVVINNLSWNNNLSLTIRKWFFIDGTIGSNDASIASLTLTGNTNNLSIINAGNVYGAGGLGGGNENNPLGGSDGNSGQNGGNACSLEYGTGINNYINLLAGSKIYAGGGGGARGGTGGLAGQGGASYTNYRRGNAPNYNDTTKGSPNAGPPSQGKGGIGGQGRGYNNLVGDLEGAAGQDVSGVKNTATANFTSGTCINVAVTSGESGASGNGGKGGSGGEFGQDGFFGVIGSPGGDGSNGTNSTSTCGFDTFPPVPSPTGTGNPGSGGAAPAYPPSTYLVGLAGKSIKTSNISYVLFGNNSNTISGAQGT